MCQACLRLGEGSSPGDSVKWRGGGPEGHWLGGKGMVYMGQDLLLIFPLISDITALYPLP